MPKLEFGEDDAAADHVSNAHVMLSRKGYNSVSELLKVVVKRNVSIR